MLVSERIKSMQSTNRWSDLRAAEFDLLAQAGSDAERAYVHAALSVATFHTNACADDWKASIRHAYECRRLASRGSTYHVWAAYQIAILSAGVGNVAIAERYARLFLDEAKYVDSLASFVPLALGVLGHIAYQNKRYHEAVRLRRIALESALARGTVGDIVRMRLNLVWTFVRLGKPSQARQFVPINTPSHMADLVDGAMAAIFYAEGDYASAVDAGSRALKAQRRADDYIDAAEVSLIVSASLRMLHRSDEAVVLHTQAALLSARQARDVSTLLVLNLRQNGGDKLNETASLGSGGFHPDACLTTGIG